MAGIPRAAPSHGFARRLIIAGRARWYVAAMLRRHRRAHPGRTCGLCAAYQKGN